MDGSCCGRSSPGGVGWVTDSCREGRDDFGGSDSDEGDFCCATSLRRGTVADASRPRLAGTLVSTTRFLRATLPALAAFGLCFARPSLSGDAPATAIATASADAGGAALTVSFVDAIATASLLSRRDAAAAADVFEDGDRFELPRFLLAIPPGLADGGTGAPVAGAGSAAVSGDEEPPEGGGTPSAIGAGTSGRGAAAAGPADPAGRPAVLTKYGAITGFFVGFGFVKDAPAAGGRAPSPPPAPGDPTPAAAVDPGAGTLGAGSHEVARLRNPWPFSALATFSTE